MLQTSVNIMAVRETETCMALVVFHIISITQKIVRVRMTRHDSFLNCVKVNQDDVGISCIMLYMLYYVF